MADNEIKTNAEIYREQRKARLAKAAKKKSSPKRDKAVRIIVKTLCIVLVAALVLFGAGRVLTNVFCIPQKTLTVATYNGQKLNAAEYNYYYMTLYNRMANTAQQYDSYYGTGYGAYLTGFDYTVDPAEQEYTASDAPEGVETWADYFKVSASTSAFFYQAIYEDATSEEAKSAGFTYDEEEMNEEINESLDSLKEYAEKYDFSLTNYISRVCGEGLTEKSYTALLQKDYIVSAYLTWYQENESDKLTTDDVTAYYNEHKSDFDMVSTRLFSVSYAEKSEDDESDDPTYTKDEAKKRADEFLSKITDEASFKTLAKEYAPASKVTSYEEDSATLLDGQKKSAVSITTLADWLYDSSRAAGDKAVIDDEDNSCYYIAYITVAPHPDVTDAGVSVRHILFQAATEDEDGEDLSEDEIAANEAAAKKNAEETLEEWKNGDATEDSFAALATEKSEDTGSTETGGLYEDINADSSYVTEFKAWAIDTSRKPGDTGIVKTDYGYHIMYFVSASGEKKWQSDVRSTVASDSYNTYIEDLYEKIDDEIKVKDTLVNYFSGRLQDTISKSVG